MAYENYTIKQFENAWFKKDYSELSKAEFDIVYAEYQDASGLFMTDDFEKQSYVYHLNGRINYVKLFIKLQREFLLEFEMPFIRDFETIKNNYGYVLKWNGDGRDFEAQLKKIEKREQKNISYLNTAIKELQDLRAANKNKKKVDEDDDSLIKSRQSFIKMRNSLGKMGYIIDVTKTTVEELTLIIKQQMDDVEAFKIRNN